MPTTTPLPWWSATTVYQIYPRSFQDSDGDGIGDLRGILTRLDYIESLGIDVVWLNPIFASPNDDMGYDISDYRRVMEEFGTMEDFDALLAGLHGRGIRLILDLVVNHSSDEHAWFEASRSSRDNPYRDYYHWWPAEQGRPTPRFSFLDEQRDAWRYEEKTHAYYLHYFSRKQPDLNWENPQVRREIYDLMRFWLDKGIDGFRMDVIAFISKDLAFPPQPADPALIPNFYANGPRLHDYLQEMHEEVLRHYDILTVGEAFGVGREEALNFVDPARRELNMIYHFDGVHLPALSPGNDPSFDLVAFKKIYTDWDAVFAEKGWGTIYLGNHDQPRMVSRWGNDTPEFREVSAKMLTTFLLSMRATPFWLAGDELGMTNPRFDRIEDYRDILTLNAYARIEAEGGDVQALLDREKQLGRDNSRTPMQWSDAPQAGFTTGQPWLKVNPNYTSINVASQERDPDSVLHYFRRMLRLRKERPTLIYGRYRLLDEDNPHVYAYLREDEDLRLLVLLNFSSRESAFELGFRLSDYEVLINNYADGGFTGRALRPYEAVVLAV